MISTTCNSSDSIAIVLIGIDPPKTDPNQLGPGKQPLQDCFRVASEVAVPPKPREIEILRRFKEVSNS
jgi:hypothetical protein